MKNRIVITKENDKIHFYLHCSRGTHYLFSQSYSKQVYQYFHNGKYENEIKNFKDWKRNPRLNKTIERIPRQTAYILKEIA